MVDVVDRKTRSRMMAGIGSTDTAPELAVRHYLHATGLRFILHDKRLPGCPDIVLPQHRVAIFVNGCFWHRHEGCRFATTPVTNAGFWRRKFKANVDRDAAKIRQLTEAGWTVLTVWECEIRDVTTFDSLYWRIRASSVMEKRDDSI